MQFPTESGFTAASGGYVEYGTGEEVTGMEIMKPRAATWLDTYGPMAKHNIAESYVEPLSIRELMALSGEEDAQAFLKELMDTKLDYGEIDGSQGLRRAIAGFYAHKDAGNVMLTHGAIASNYIVLFGLLSPGDKVITTHPNYQQLYAVPAAFGVDMHLLELRREDGYLPNLDELRRAMEGGCRMLILSNPNNPTSSVMDRAYLEKIVELAREAGAYLLCDEIYLGYPRDGVELARVADLYEKGISTGSFSKVYGLSGARVGWIAADQSIIEAIGPYRNYTAICCGQLGDAVASLAMKSFERLMARNEAIVRENLDYLRAWLEKTPSVSCDIPPAGTFVLLRYARPVSSETFCSGLFEATGAFIMPGSCFDMEGTLRLGIGGDPSHFKAGLACLAQYLEEMEGGRHHES